LEKTQFEFKKSGICIYFVLYLKTHAPIFGDIGTDFRGGDRFPVSGVGVSVRSGAECFGFREGIDMARLFLFTDEPVQAKGLEIALSSASEFELVAVCGEASQLVETMESSRPDLLLMDLIPELTFGVLVDLQRRFPGSRIVLWVRSISTEMAYQSIEHGVRGILRKTLPPETLVKCLRMVHEGGLWFEEALKTSFLSVRTISLTRRESQLVSLLSQGLKNKEIAASLFISEGTVKVYLSRLFHKLGVKDRFELALYGLKNMPAGEGLFEMPQSRPVQQPQRKQAAQAQLLRSLVLERPALKVRGPGGIFES